jgi:hypothetical protein
VVLGLLELAEQVVGALNGAGDELRKEADVDREAQKRRRRRLSVR